MISFLPGTYGTSLLRNHALRGVFEEMAVQGFPSEVVDAIKDSVDCNLYFFGDKVGLGNIYVVLIASIGIAIGLYVGMNILLEKNSTGNETPGAAAQDGQPPSFLQIRHGHL